MSALTAVGKPENLADSWLVVSEEPPVAQSEEKQVILDQSKPPSDAEAVVTTPDASLKNGGVAASSLPAVTPPASELVHRSSPKDSPREKPKQDFDDEKVDLTPEPNGCRKFAEWFISLCRRKN